MENCPFNHVLTFRYTPEAITHENIVFLVGCHKTCFVLSLSANHLSATCKELNDIFLVISDKLHRFDSCEVNKRD
ncbi:unnamed protein product [Ceratitis capitata]|uniref:(Mediterranean fruit fly) hypothetical protein n=1 Tax=Ceratitis capitata TaxID=7213 RepID=A0A811VHL3_CERCA|nr:unnamed protein product [Ceratitis capitata]